MPIADKFVKNLKALLDKKTFDDSDVKTIMMTIQEMATLSCVETISLIDNFDILIEESGKEMPDEELAALKKELLEE